VGEIAQASHEQRQGIDQVNSALTQMDQVTQKNAASAEETASSSEQLHAQSDNLKFLVQELEQMVWGQHRMPLSISAYKG